MVISPQNHIRVRIAPSPTGHMHVGLARTALFNWLFAKQNKGEFLLRIEDTDIERSKREFEDEIREGLRWLNLNWDGEVYRQSERREIYRKYLEKLIAEKRAYYCYCSKEDLEAERQSMVADGLPPKYRGHCRTLTNAPRENTPGVIRFIVPEVKVDFKDLIRGKVEFDAGLFGDIVIAIDLDRPLYNFAVVIDDWEMKISHVIRGEDHIANTPKQILLQKALGFDTPIYAHIPLILDTDRKKLSKRANETSLLEYRNLGFLPEAMINFLVLLGWHPEGNEEIFSLEEMVAIFNLTRVQKGGAVFNQEKLDWLSGQYISSFTASEIYSRLKEFKKDKKLDDRPEFVQKIIEVLKERMKTWEDFWHLSDFFFELPDYEIGLLRWKEQSLPDIQIILNKVLDQWREIDESDFVFQNLQKKLEILISGATRGEVLWPLRVSLSGKSVSPDPLEIAQILGKSETLKRIQGAIEKIS